MTFLRLTPEQIGQRADAYEAQYGLPRGYLRTTLSLESSGGKNRRASRAGASSIAQIMPSTARQYGFNPAELNSNDDAAIRAAAVIAHDNARRFGNDPVTLGIAYNAGPRYARQFLADHNISALPVETQHYIQAFTPHSQSTYPWMVAKNNSTVYNEPLQSAAIIGGDTNGGLNFSRYFSGNLERAAGSAIPAGGRYDPSTAYSSIDRTVVPTTPWGSTNGTSSLVEDAAGITNPQYTAPFADGQARRRGDVGTARIPNSAAGHIFNNHYL